MIKTPTILYASSTAPRRIAAGLPLKPTSSGIKNSDSTHKQRQFFFFWGGGERLNGIWTWVCTNPNPRFSPPFAGYWLLINCLFARRSWKISKLTKKFYHPIVIVSRSSRTCRHIHSRTPTDTRTPTHTPRSRLPRTHSWTLACQSNNFPFTIFLTLVQR